MADKAFKKFELGLAIGRGIAALARWPVTEFFPFPACCNLAVAGVEAIVPCLANGVLDAGNAITALDSVTFPDIVVAVLSRFGIPTSPLPPPQLANSKAKVAGSKADKKKLVSFCFRFMTIPSKFILTQKFLIGSGLSHG